MTLQKLASAIAKREGKKSQARIGDIREILKIIVTLAAEFEVENTSGDVAPLISVFDEPTSKLAAKIRAKLKKALKVK